MIQVKEYKGDNRVWDNFVESSNNGTIFNKLSFLDYHGKGKIKFHNIVFLKNNKIIGLISGEIKGRSYISPAGASYGSFVVPDIDFSTYEEIIDAFLKYCKKKGIKNISLTLPPIIYLKKEHEIEKFLLIYKGFKLSHHLITNSLYIKNRGIEEIRASFTDMHKRAINKSYKEGVVVKISNDYDSFYKILLKNKKKFDAHPTHTLDEIKWLANKFRKDIVLLMAYNKDDEKQAIAGILVFKCNKKTSLAFYICSDYDFKDKRAVNRLFYELIVWSKKKSLEWVDLGVSMNTLSDNVMEPSRSLIFFKEGIGSRGLLRSTFTYRFS